MSLFSKLFKMFVGVVLMPVVPTILLLAYYQVHLKNNILETHANLAQIVSSSLNQHIEDLNLTVASRLTVALRHCEERSNPELYFMCLDFNLKIFLRRLVRHEFVGR